MKKEELRIIPPKNYIILGLILVVTFLILYYFYMWFDAYKDSKVNIMILDKYMDIINYNELDNYLVENPDSIIYMSVLENEQIREFEKKVKQSYKEDKITKNILYLNVTSDIDDSNNVKEIENKYLNNLKIKSIPSVIVFDNGVVKDVYSVIDNDYDIDEFISYVNGIVLVGDDIK